uniref:Uncharacterized protein n=1 Tax=Sphaerodactylus townsendi TaxID=933632 RepID=A0ACB8FCM7_9SAUR
MASGGKSGREGLAAPGPTPPLGGRTPSECAVPHPEKVDILLLSRTRCVMEGFLHDLQYATVGSDRRKLQRRKTQKALVVIYRTLKRIGSRERIPTGGTVVS